MRGIGKLSCLVALVAFMGASMPAEARLSANKLAANRIALNKLSANKIATNRIALNRLAVNRLAVNRLAGNSLAANAVTRAGAAAGEGAVDAVAVIELADGTRLTR